MASCAARSPLTACAKESRCLSLKELAALQGFHNFRQERQNGGQRHVGSCPEGGNEGDPLGLVTVEPQLLRQELLLFNLLGRWPCFGLVLRDCKERVNLQ